MSAVRSSLRRSMASVQPAQGVIGLREFFLQQAVHIPTRASLIFSCVHYAGHFLL